MSLFNTVTQCTAFKLRVTIWYSKGGDVLLVSLKFSFLPSTKNVPPCFIHNSSDPLARLHKTSSFSNDFRLDFDDRPRFHFHDLVNLVQTPSSQHSVAASLAS